VQKHRRKGHEKERIDAEDLDGEYSGIL